jgi:uncharacterized protein YigE (DUF2233 family)
MSRVNLCGTMGSALRVAGTKWAGTRRLIAGLVLACVVGACRRSEAPRATESGGSSAVVATVASGAGVGSGSGSGAEGGGAGPSNGPAPPAWGSAHGETFRVTQESFDLGAVELSIVDMHMGRSLGPALDQAQGVLAVNGGFFDPKGAPLGLAVSRGAKLSSYSRGMSGGVLTVDGGRGRLWETETFDAGLAHDFAVQCKPRLVVDSKVNIRSDDGKRSERTTLCLKKAGRELHVHIIENDDGGPSLLATAEYLKEQGCEDALNLDGGPSTGMARKLGARTEAVGPRGPIRHAVVVKRMAAAP